MILNCRYHVYRIIVSDVGYRLKLAVLGYISVAECLRLYSATFKQCDPEAAKFGEKSQNMGHFAVQSHSRSPILVPIESSYTTSY